MSRVISGGSRVLAVAAALILAIGVLQPHLASAQTSITLYPTSGQANVTTVNVTGSGFQTGETVNVTFQNFGQVASATATGANGAIATQFVVPAGATPGLYNVTATGAISGSHASAPFQVFNGPATALSLSKSVSGPTNGVLSYQISYQNTGPNTATNVVITDQLQAGQSLLVSSLSVGCNYTSPGGVVTVTCTIGNVPASPNPGSAGAVYFQTQVNSGFNGTINNTATITAGNAATQNSNTTSVTIGTGNPGSTSLQKTVEDNSNGYFSTGVNANPGDVVTYDVAYINNSTTTTAPNVTVTDTLQPGQSYLGPPYSSSNCVQQAFNTISCPIGNVPPGTRVDTFISASLASNIPGTQIHNQAQATSNGTTINSNITVVQVGGTPPPPCTTCCSPSTTCCTTTTSCCFNGFAASCTNGNFILCGPVTAYTGTSITVNDVTVAILPGATVVTTPAVGANECVTFLLNSSAQATSLGASANLAGAGVACGTYLGTTNFGALNVTGIGIALAPTATFQPLLTVGGFYCFLLNSAGQAYNVLSGVPTSLSAAAAGGHAQVGTEKLL
jgi:uncharacterized repeat protein (TIGR01451 family)